MWTALTVTDSIFQISQCLEKFNFEKIEKDSSKTIGNNQKIVK